MMRILVIVGISRANNFVHHVAIIVIIIVVVVVVVVIIIKKGDNLMAGGEDGRERDVKLVLQDGGWWS